MLITECMIEENLRKAYYTSFIEFRSKTFIRLKLIATMFVKSNIMHHQRVYFS